MAKSKHQKQLEAAWRQARLELLRDYDQTSDQQLQASLDDARRGKRDWETYRLERQQRDREQWLTTFLSADAKWLMTALQEKTIPRALAERISAPMRAKGLEHLLPEASAPRAAKPRF